MSFGHIDTGARRLTTAVMTRRSSGPCTTKAGSASYRACNTTKQPFEELLLRAESVGNTAEGIKLHESASLPRTVHESASLPRTVLRRASHKLQA